MLRRVGTDQPTDIGGTTLQIYLLGPPIVKWNGNPLAIPRRQVRAILYRIAAETHPLPREHLCYLFWPDTPESTARRNLTCLMSHLRRALPTPGLVVTSDDRIWLAPDRIWSDTATFKRLCESPEAHVRDRTLQQAIDLHRGPLLNGFSLPHNPEFETWLTLERQAWERLYLETLATLIEDQTTKGKYDAAIASAQRYLATDDLAEDTHRRLIELYATIGDRNAAMRQFERCITILERELGVTPLPETQAVYRVVLEGQSPPRIVPLARPAWTTLPGLDVPLVGRDRVWRQLEKAYLRACAAQGSIVLISGEAGIGKSRLIQDFATHLQDQAQVLTGSGHPDTQTMPYQPLIEALHPALHTRHSLIDVQPIWLAEASRLMPELQTLHPDLPPPMPMEPDQARTRLFEALCRLILGLAAGPHPTILCLDDLHWADSTTLDWLAYLGRRLVGTRLLIVGAYRSEEDGTMAELRHNLTRQGLVSEFEIEGLGNAEILQLLRHLGDAVPNDGVLADRLCQATGGNPFFLLETLQVLLETDQRVEKLANVKDLLLPDTIRDAVEARVGRLSPQARQVLEASAVLGQTCTFDLVHLTAGRREMETIDGLDELVARQLLTEQTAGYRFRHEIIRAAIYRELGYWRRRVLHRRAGEALENLRVDNATALARHFERAEEPGRAARYALQAGQAAKAVFGHAEACAYFDRTLALLEQEAAYLQKPKAIAANRRLRIHVLDERGWALRLKVAHTKEVMRIPVCQPRICFPMQGERKEKCLSKKFCLPF